jgi:type IV pilus assembly protein PilO
VASLGLGKLPWHVQLGVFLLLALAGVGAFYYLYEIPQQAAMDVQRGELATIRARLDKGRETARQLPDFRSQVGELEARLDSLKSILPEERDVGDLLRRVQTLATQSNLTILGFRPQAITTREIHAEWPIGLQLEGTYHNLGLFLDRVSKFPRIINVGSLQLKTKANATPAATIEVACTATTFVLVDPAAAAAAAPKKKGAPAKKDQPAAKTE